MLVAVAVLAMLAFFVLPPFLQMGAGSSSADPIVVSWKGGGVRENQLERAVAMRTLANRFLMQAAAAAGRDPSRLPAFPEGEELVVREMLLAKEAEKIGLTVSNTAINEFIAAWTNNMVRQDQLDGIIAGLRYGRAPVLAGDLFESLRTALVARNTLLLFQTGFSGDPPGWRWDFYKRLEQSVTIKAFPVEVENFAMSVEAPSESELKAYFEKFKDNLPSARSPDPGFKEPHRIRYASLMADQKKFEDEAGKTITEKDVEDFYEENKEVRFRQSPPDPPPSQEPPTDSSDQKSELKEEKSSNGKNLPAENPDSPIQAKQDTKEEMSEENSEQKDKAGKPSESDSSSAKGKTRVLPVAFQANEDTSETDPTPKDKDQPPDEKPITGNAIPDSVEGQPAGSDMADKEKNESAESSEPKMTFQPLEDVAEQIRQDIARQRATETIDTIFSAIAADLNAYAEDRALWIARGKEGDKEPTPPDVNKIAEKQSLVAVESDWVTVNEANEGGGIGTSFDFVPDPTSRFGIRQQRWLETMFADGTITLRPVTSRDAEGNRYFSWKQDDQEERVPTFTEARSNVEKAWRIVEARPLALTQAKNLAAKVDEKGFAEAVSKDELEAVREIGPFTWLTQGSAGVNAAPVLSSPKGLVLSGNAMMQKVFSTAEGKSAAVFNEPRTICYVIRVQAFNPKDEELQSRFESVLGDQRRLSMVAQSAFAEIFMDWIAGLEKDLELTWNREPRLP